MLRQERKGPGGLTGQFFSSWKGFIYKQKGINYCANAVAMNSFIICKFDLACSGSNLLNMYKFELN
jgi:hypothetical protein